MDNILFGVERLIQDKTVFSSVKDGIVGLVAHPASITTEMVHTLDLLRSKGVVPKFLFGPEHGFCGEAQDMESVSSDALGPYSLPLFSLYGDTLDDLAPSDDLVSQLDVLVVDLFDIGSRYYTFVWTALLCLRTCHRLGKEMVLLDRPNPLGGEAVEGGVQDSGYLSFVGLAKTANRHGLTPGELVKMAAVAEGIEDALQVVPMKGWRRGMFYGHTDLPWVYPSPNMPTFDTALVYPGMCLIEGTFASEGRGTTRPFELVGAPGMDGMALQKRLDAMDLKGVRFRPVSFKPGFQKHAGQICGGVQLHVVDPIEFKPYLTGVAVLLALRAEAGDRFQWRHEPYEFVTNRPAIDLLTGSPAVREGVEQGASLLDIAATWKAGEETFMEQRKEFFLYDY